LLCYTLLQHHQFQSAPPVKGAMRHLSKHGNILQFQSAPPVKGAICVTRTEIVD